MIKKVSTEDWIYNLQDSFNTFLHLVKVHHLKESLGEGERLIDRALSQRGKDLKKGSIIFHVVRGGIRGPISLVLILVKQRGKIR